MQPEDVDACIPARHPALLHWAKWAAKVLSILDYGRGQKAVKIVQISDLR